MNTIKSAKKGAAERSADNYIDAVETAVATKRLDNVILEGTYTINDKGNLEGNGLTKPLEIEMKGNKPTGGTITIKDGQVATSSKMTVGSYEVAYNSISKKYEATKTVQSTIVYRCSEENVKIGDTMNDPTKYTTTPSTLGKNYYLKHILDKDNKITESYVCVIFNSKEYCLTNGEYGNSENEADYTGNMLILKNLRDSKIEGISCNFDTVYSTCDVGSVRLYANADGYVAAADGGFLCTVFEDDSSNCGSW